MKLSQLIRELEDIERSFKGGDMDVLAKGHYRFGAYEIRPVLRVEFSLNAGQVYVHTEDT